MNAEELKTELSLSRKYLREYANGQSIVASFCDKAVKEIESLQAQLSASQARERAAVEAICNQCRYTAKQPGIVRTGGCEGCKWRSPHDGEVKQDG